MNQSMVGSLVEAVDEAVKRLDFDRVSREYWDQNEFLVLPQFLSRSVVEEHLVPQAQGVKSELNRNYIPGHKKGGSVSYYTVMEKAPRFLDLYRSGAFIEFLSRLVQAKLSLALRTTPIPVRSTTIRSRGTISGFTMTRPTTRGLAIPF
jgi:hypothetical protein